MILELLEDRVKGGKTREWLTEQAEKEMFQTVIKLSLQDTPASEEIMRVSPDQFKENFERNWTGPMQTEHQNGRWTDCSRWKASFNAQISGYWWEFLTLSFSI